MGSSRYRPRQSVRHRVAHRRLARVRFRSRVFLQRAFGYGGVVARLPAAFRADSRGRLAGVAPRLDHGDPVIWIFTAVLWFGILTLRVPTRWALTCFETAMFVFAIGLIARRR